MKRLIYLLGVLFLTSSLLGQERLKSGLIQVPSFPTNNGDGTFTMVGTFSDPTGLTFSGDIAPGFMVNQGNNFFLVQSSSSNGATVTVAVEDTYGVGFMPSGNYSVGELTENLQLPGIAPTGDSNASLATPPDQATKWNLILQRIDRRFDDLVFVPQKGDTIFQASHGFQLGTVLSQESANGPYFGANTADPDSFPVGLVVEVLTTDTFVIDHTGWIYNLPSSLDLGTDYFLQDDGSLGTTADAEHAVFVLRTSSVTAGKAYFDIPELVIASGVGSGGTDIAASNGLNDQDSGQGVDVELGGPLDKNTVIDALNNETLDFNFIAASFFSSLNLAAGFSRIITTEGDLSNSVVSERTSANLVSDNSATGNSANVQASAILGATMTYSVSGGIQPGRVQANTDGASISASSATNSSQVLVRPTYIALEGVPSYADDAAADADVNLPSGAIYRIGSDRILRIKP